MGTLTGIDPLTLLGVAATAAAIRVVALVVALRGTAPSDRPAIIRALAELFRVLPRRRR